MRHKYLGRTVVLICVFSLAAAACGDSGEEAHVSKPKTPRDLLDGGETGALLDEGIVGLGKLPRKTVERVPAHGSAVPTKHWLEILEALDKDDVKPNPITLPALGQASSEIPSIEGDLVEEEPVYEADARGDIQGNVIPGFNKDHQHFLFYRFGAVPAAKAWLR